MGNSLFVGSTRYRSSYRIPAQSLYLAYFASFISEIKDKFLVFLWNHKKYYSVVAQNSKKYTKFLTKSNPGALIKCR